MFSCLACSIFLFYSLFNLLLLQVQILMYNQLQFKISYIPISSNKCEPPKIKTKQNKKPLQVKCKIVFLKYSAYWLCKAILNNWKYLIVYIQRVSHTLWHSIRLGLLWWIWESGSAENKYLLCLCYEVTIEDPKRIQ